MRLPKHKTKIVCTSGPASKSPRANAHESDHPEVWKAYAQQWMLAHGVEGNLVVLTEGPFTKHPEANHRMEILDLGNQRTR